MLHEVNSKILNNGLDTKLNQTKPKQNIQKHKIAKMLQINVVNCVRNKSLTLNDKIKENYVSTTYMVNGRRKKIHLRYDNGKKMQKR